MSIDIKTSETTCPCGKTLYRKHTIDIIVTQHGDDPKDTYVTNIGKLIQENKENPVKAMIIEIRDNLRKFHRRDGIEVDDGIDEFLATIQ